MSSCLPGPSGRVKGRSLHAGARGGTLLIALKGTPMPKLLVVFIVLAVVAVTWLQPAGDADKVSYEAKAAFLKKCIRDITPGACQAPEDARVPVAR